MPSGFPNSIDSFTDPLASSPLNSPSHAGQHQDLNDAVNKIETFMGLVLVKSQTIGTAVSSVTVTDAFSANYENYKVIISSGVCSTSTDLRLQLGATTTGYYTGYNRVTFSSAAAALAADNNAANFSRAAFGTPNTLNANFDLLMPFATKNTMYYGAFIAAGSGFNAGTGSGFLDNSTSYTAFTLIVPSGTITGGTIKVYGYRN
jgi:hypothetical protein